MGFCYFLREKEREKCKKKKEVNIGKENLRYLL